MMRSGLLIWSQQRWSACSSDPQLVQHRTRYIVSMAPLEGSWRVTGRARTTNLARFDLVWSDRHNGIHQRAGPHRCRRSGGDPDAVANPRSRIGGLAAAPPPPSTPPPTSPPDPAVAASSFQTSHSGSDFVRGGLSPGTRRGRYRQISMRCHRILTAH